VHTYIHTNTHACTHTHTQTYIYTHRDASFGRRANSIVAQSGAGSISELRGNGGKGVHMYRYICI